MSAAAQVWMVIYLTPFCIASLICATILQARSPPARAVLG